MSTSHIFADHLVDLAERLYADPSLTYHNWGHVESVMRAYKKLYGPPTPEAMIAIAFHDCVYVPGAPTGVNEDLSILQMRRAFRETAKHYSGVLPDLKLIELMIESTKVNNHLSSVYMSVIEDDHGFAVATEVGKVLDCDLSGFWQTWRTFVDLQDAIIYEYAGHPVLDTDLMEGRRASAEFLKKFLHKDRIYYTDAAHTTFEQAARANLMKWATKNGVFT